METKSPRTGPYTVTVRRNPHRRARPTTSTKCDQQVSVPPPEVLSFPIDEILAMEVPENSDLKPKPNPNSESTSESLRVFLRVRPILSSSSPTKCPNPKPRAKNAWPQNPAKKNSSVRTAKKKSPENVCVTVNDSHSVTLSPPLALQESKRIKPAVYEGFSHVFAPDSSQEQVFEKMVCSLVDDFLRGKSGMLAALGPSGSGKTHTVFGSPRDPGVVPRTLQRIFGPNSDSASESQRSFSISIFEIHSERGKGEKLFDLCNGGAELSMQQSAIKGLQEVVVSDPREAESLVAQAMLRRLTAMTNSNSQSSRSQCIINIRSVPNDSKEEDDFPDNNAVLSIIDLAGAEREKKTGNQGARLLESNFINNTSMVFGLCLRSLLEHQKNPKRPLQKHFQNSLLTRYLRDYLEGKKRMTLILTVKPGEEDYLDTTYLLRQASPFMRIRFDNVEEQTNISCNKRQSQALSRREKSKKMRVDGSNNTTIEEKKISEDERSSPTQGCLKEDSKSDFSSSAPSEFNNVELAKSERSYQILQKFSKALWTVLKQHGKQVKVAEHEIQHLTENLKLEKMRNIELEKELEYLKSCCTCSQQIPVEVALAESETTFKPTVELEGLSSNNFDESREDLSSSNFSLPDCNGTLLENGSLPRLDHTISSQSFVFPGSVMQKNLDHPSTVRVSEADKRYQKCNSNNEQNLDIFSQVKEETFSSDSNELKCVDNEPESDTPVRSLGVDEADGSTLCDEISQKKYQLDESFCGNGNVTEDSQKSRCSETDDTCTTTHVTDHSLGSSQPLVLDRDDSNVSVEVDHQVAEEGQELVNLPKTGKSDVVSSKGVTVVDIADESDSKSEKPKKSLDRLTPAKENINVTEDRLAPNTKQRVDTPSQSGKPKRRLLPASSALLRDLNTLDIDDKSEKPKGIRVGKKNSADERSRTQGSIALLRMLNSNIHV